MTLSATSWQWRCNHAVINRAKWNLQQFSDLTRQRPSPTDQTPSPTPSRFMTMKEIFSLCANSYHASLAGAEGPVHTQTGTGQETALLLAGM